jgi:hypothetical protein
MDQSKMADQMRVFHVISINLLYLFGNPCRCRKNSSCGPILFLQHEMVGSYRFMCSEHESVKFFGKKSEFSIYQKNLRGNKHGRFFFDKTQNGGVNQDGGFK